jgi:Na+-transporting methylmalonyl-CoA/oxaloacetate decarboxylase gamma subunit
MANSKAMSIGAMLVLLVLVVAFLPALIRYIGEVEVHYIVSGFEDMVEEKAQAQHQAQHQAQEHQESAFVDHDQAFIDVPSAARGMSLATGQADPFCRKACPEGSFCDNHSKSCVSNYVGGTVPSDGYYA